jgi:hypothetical protein
MLHLHCCSFTLALGASDAAGHCWQTELDVAPTVGEYLPVMHSEHTFGSAAAAVLYVPAKHGVQVSGLVAPTTVEIFPAAHSVHTVLPGVLANLPATHWLHVSPYALSVLVVCNPAKRQHATLRNTKKRLVLHMLSCNPKTFFEQTCTDAVSGI